MKAKHIVAGSVAALILGLSGALVYAHPGFGPRMMGAMHGGPGFAGPAAAQQLMTPEERTALIQKMQAAKTPEERQKIAEATRTEMQKRAKEKGITLPHGPGPGFGPGFAPPFANPTH